VIQRGCDARDGVAAPSAAHRGQPGVRPTFVFREYFVRIAV